MTKTGEEIYKELADARLQLTMLGMINSNQPTYEKMIELNVQYQQAQDRYAIALAAKINWVNNEAKRREHEERPKEKTENK